MATIYHDLEDSLISPLDVLKSLQGLTIVWNIPTGGGGMSWAANTCQLSDSSGNLHIWRSRPGGVATTWRSVPMYLFFNSLYFGATEAATGRTAGPLSYKTALQSAYNAMTNFFNTSYITANPTNGTGRFSANPTSLVTLTDSIENKKIFVTMMSLIKTVSHPGYATDPPPPIKFMPGYPDTRSYDIWVGVEESTVTAQQNVMCNCEGWGEPVAFDASPLVERPIEVTEELAFDGKLKDADGNVIDFAALWASVANPLAKIDEIVKDQTIQDLPVSDPDAEIAALEAIQLALETPNAGLLVKDQLNETNRQLSLIESRLYIPATIDNPEQSITQRTGSMVSGGSLDVKLLNPDNSDMDLREAIAYIVAALQQNTAGVTAKLEPFRGFIEKIRQELI
jgi:hypothetical protein